MLVLSRKEHEEIVIDGCIRLRIVRVQGHRVRIGIEAPQGVAVLRAEITQQPAGPSAVPARPVEAACC
jgi:carbon storage regulator